MAVKIRSAAEHVAIVEFGEPPHNFFDVDVIIAIANAYAKLSADKSCRAIILCSEGKHFCAGANFRRAELPNSQAGTEPKPHLYVAAQRLFDYDLPVIAATQGSVIGGGLGLALSADFRVASIDTRFAANFSRIGLHQGFGITATLPRVVGQQKALDMLYSGRDVLGGEALEIGLCDRLAATATPLQEATRFATELVKVAPLALRSIRKTMWSEVSEAMRSALYRELSEQTRLRSSEDFKRGVNARRGEIPNFQGD
jgi:enoyl-CoA hydratase/carnithine racemase